MSGRAGEDWRKVTEGLLGSRDPPAPARPALIVVDMQRYFLEQGAPAYLGAEGILPQVQRLLDAFEKYRLPIFATRYSSGESDGPVEKWWNVRLERDDKWAVLDPRITYPASTVVLDKNMYGSFSSTDIDARLKTAGCDSVFVCGVMTHLCCETTAREAFHLGYDVYFVADANATSTIEMHLSTLRVLAHGFAYVVSAEHVFDLLEGTDG
jgi:bifunctional isochorismate lyase/aryl carrier protein